LKAIAWNLAQNYWTQIDGKEWQQLFDLIIQKGVYVSQLIFSGKTAKQRLKAEQALDELTQLLCNNLVSRISQTTPA